MIQKRCRKCGCTWEQFKMTGLFGCPHCYQTFEQELLPNLTKIQSKSVHNGAKPKLVGEDKQLFDRYIRLLKEKELACLSGQFIQMAQINAELIEVTDQLKRKGVM